MDYFLDGYQLVVDHANHTLGTLSSNSAFYRLSLSDYLQSSLLHGTFLLTGPLVVTLLLVRLEMLGQRNALNRLLVALLVCLVFLCVASSAFAAVPLTLEDLRRTLLALSIVASADLLLFRGALRMSQKTAWFSLHAFANFLVVVWSFQPTVFVLVHPYRSYESPEATQNFAHFVMLALHLYHIVAYNTSAMDLVHHLVSAGLIGGIALAWPLSLIHISEPTRRS